MMRVLVSALALYVLQWQLFFYLILKEITDTFQQQQSYIVYYDKGDTMSKFEALWQALQTNGSATITLSFLDIENILSFPLDHSFLTYKKEAINYGYQVKKISLKGQWIIFDHLK